MYSLYKKKRKHYIIFNNLRIFEDEHSKLTGDLDWHVRSQLDEFNIFSLTITSRFPSSCKGTHETKSHKNSMLWALLVPLKLQTPYARKHFGTIFHHFSNALLILYNEVWESPRHNDTVRPFTENIVQNTAKK